MESGEQSGRPLVLLVDDNQDLLDIYELVLVSAGYRVVTAPDGRTALDLVRRLQPSVVVLDMMMPVMSGLEFLDELSRGDAPAPPIIASSGFPGFEHLARERGARAFLGKPASPDDLLDALACVLAGREDLERERGHAARIATGREQASAARAELWARLDLDDPELRRMLEGVLSWLATYHGFGTGLVDLLRDPYIYVEAGSAAGRSVDRGLAFCSDVVDAGSSLVISDTAVHPVFAGHRASVYWGTRFYAGCPITTSSGLVLGTVCLIDGAPRRFEVGDMRILEYLAQRVGEHLEALAEGRRLEPFFEPPALFERGFIDVLINAQLVGKWNLILVELARDRCDAQLLQRAVEAVNEVASGARFAAARWAPEVLSLVLDGADPNQTTVRALAALRSVDIVPDAVGVGELRRAADQPPQHEGLIAAAETACHQSAAEGGAVAHVRAAERAGAPRAADARRRTPPRCGGALR